MAFGKTNISLSHNGVTFNQCTIKNLVLQSLDNCYITFSYAVVASLLLCKILTFLSINAYVVQFYCGMQKFCLWQLPIFEWIEDKINWFHDSIAVNVFFNAVLE